MNRKSLWSLPALLVLTLSSPAAEADRYLPADTEQVVVVNVKQITGSPLFKKYLLPEIEKHLQDNKDYKQLQEATGFDLLKDVSSIVAANAGGTGKKAMVIVRGKFNQDKIHKTALAIAEQGKLKISKLGDRNLYEAANKDETVFATFIDDTTLVASPDKAFVTAAADGKGGKVSKEMAAALEAADSKQSIWMAGLLPEDVAKSLAQAQGQAEALKKVKSGGGGITITDSIVVSASASTDDPAAAKELAKVLDSNKALLNIVGATNEMIKPFADEVLKTLAIKTDKGNVTVSFKLSEDLVKKATELIPKKPE